MLVWKCWKCITCDYLVGCITIRRWLYLYRVGLMLVSSVFIVLMKYMSWLYRMYSLPLFCVVYNSIGSVSALVGKY